MLCSTLPFPCPLEEYRRQALQPGRPSLPPQYRRFGAVLRCALPLTPACRLPALLPGRQQEYTQHPSPLLC